MTADVPRPRSRTASTLRLMVLLAVTGLVLACTVATVLAVVYQQVLRAS